MIASAATLDPASAKKLLELFDTQQRKATWLIDRQNVFKLDLRGAETERVGILSHGRIHAVPCYVRNGRRLPVAGFYARMIEVLRQTSDFATMMSLIDKTLGDIPATDPKNREFLRSQHLQVLEVMAQDGWVERKCNGSRPALRVGNEVQQIRLSRDANEALRRVGRSSIMRSRIDEESAQA